MKTPTPEEIIEKWRFVNLAGSSLAVTGNSHPGETLAALRGARDDVAFLYNALVAERLKNAELEARLKGIQAGS